mgnify:CR=1 FL=1|tara:strand:- start:710 stop:1075 length:366 start_codon:yes stop_codon:yes gene_type:complete
MYNDSTMTKTLYTDEWHTMLKSRKIKEFNENVHSIHIKRESFSIITPEITYIHYKIWTNIHNKDFAETYSCLITVSIDEMIKNIEDMYIKRFQSAKKPVKRVSKKKQAELDFAEYTNSLEF